MRRHQHSSNHRYQAVDSASRSVLLAQRILSLLLPLLFASFAHAHPISISSAVIDVQPNAIEVELEIMLEDLVLYHQLAADGNMKYAATDLRRAATAHRELLRKWFTILDSDGTKLSGEHKSLDEKEIDDEGVGQTELMRRTIRYQMVYPLSTAPKFLTFMQKMGGDTSVLPAVMDLHILKQGSVGDKPEQILFGRPHTTEFDWSIKPAGKRLSMSELRAQREQQKRQRLGIASYSGLYSFLYITRFEVRHELLIPLVTLEQWIPIARRDKDFLEIQEQQQLKESVDKFFRNKSSVIINGQSIPATLSRMNVFGLDINDFALNAPPRRVSMSQARVGVILNFPSKEIPKSVEVKWSTFNEYAPFIHSVVLVGNERPIEHDFQSLDETFRWNGDLSAPRINSVTAPRDTANPEDLKAPLTQLLNNIYQAFEYRDDEKVYDALATSVDGPLLKELYLQVKRSLLMAEQGGAQSRVTLLEVTEVVPAKPTTPGAYEVSWKLSTETEHWGHIHLRSSQYRARLTLSTSDKKWRPKAFQILDEQRLSFETSIRGYDSNP